MVAVDTLVIGSQLDEETEIYVRGVSRDLVTIPPVDAAHELRWQNRTPRAGAEIGPGAAGCLLAHEKVWEMVAAREPIEGELFLVLEDDAVLTVHGHNWLQRIAEKSARARLSLVHLGRTKHRPPRFMGSDNRSFAAGFLESAYVSFPPVLRPGFTWRTHAYLITSAMANHLLDQKFDFSMPIDQRLRELFTFPNTMKAVRVATAHQPLFLQANRESLVEKRGR